MKQRIQQLVHAWQDQSISADEMVELNKLLRESEEARICFRSESEVHGVIHAAATAFMVDEASRPGRFASTISTRSAFASRLSWQAILTTAAGLFMGAFFMSVAWAFASPRMIASVERLLAFANGGFEEAIGRIPASFPKKVGVWSGDKAVVVSSASLGIPRSGDDSQRLLQFIEPGSDEGAVDSLAISCDVFQMVDLRQLRQQRDNEQELSLELSAHFYDRRIRHGVPVTFFCQMFLFTGSPEEMHTDWPTTLEDALASSKSLHHTVGGSPNKSVKLTTRCLVPSQADFAVVQLAARPDLRPAKLDSLYVDDVTLIMKSQPTLPIQVVQTK